MLAGWKCNWVETRLWALLAGELAPDEADRMQQHLERCAECRLSLERVRQTIPLVAACRTRAVPESEKTWQDLLPRLQAAEAAPITRFFSYSVRSLAWGAAVMA